MYSFQAEFRQIYYRRWPLLGGFWGVVNREVRCKCKGNGFTACPPPVLILVVLLHIDSDIMTFFSLSLMHVMFTFVSLADNGCVRANYLLYWYFVSFEQIELFWNMRSFVFFSSIWKIY